MTEIEYQLYSQRGAELRAEAAHRRLVAQARQADRARQGGTGRLGRLAAGLRRGPRQAHQAPAARTTAARRPVVSTAGSPGIGEC
ncbi:hypothetical protein OG500_24895 [Kitasatospora sp. NBC_01250]|uniref:hypothetical protein n=1 Tax=unclassified Kitasatospora TaxID=2633591 RepID=UPI002E11821D|nr:MULTISPECIES: hypothetical protein [unclassified Kitasatospora]WSJ69359.1 hypothetical protein OG294_26440 [Kitasatospora sp. NBC_01302]